MAVFISGCPRSGTSVCMDIHKEIYGEDSIIGAKFPQENKKYYEMQDFLDFGLNEDVAEYLYLKNKKITDLNNQGRDDFKDLNPNGFWECPFTVQGAFYQYRTRHLFEEVKQSNKIVKVVSQGLLNTNPDLIHQMVFMLRNPRQVAKSQERLNRNLDVNSDGKRYNAFKDAIHEENGEVVSDQLIIHSPEMFIQVTKQAIRFIIENPFIPYLFINFDDLMQNPEYWIKEIYSFNNITGGDLEAGLKVVDKKLNRSKPQEIENDFWEDADYLYNSFKQFAEQYNELINSKEPSNEELIEVISYLKPVLQEIENPKRLINQAQTIFRCYRAKVNANYKVCEQCRNDCNYTKNLKERAMEIDKSGQLQVADSWELEPCLWECGMNPNLDPISIEQSITNNTWKSIKTEMETENEIK